MSTGALRRRVERLEKQKQQKTDRLFLACYEFGTELLSTVVAIFRPQSSRDLQGAKSTIFHPQSSISCYHCRYF